MAKIKISIWLILTLFSSLGALGQYCCIEHTYNSQIGVRELSGNNDGEAIVMYLESTGLGPGYPWCAAFVNWTLTNCCVETVNSPAWSPSWFIKDNIVWVRNRDDNAPPIPGDVFGIYFPTKKRVAHVGFIDCWQCESSVAITVEGNTNNAGSREGDGVYRKRRLKKQIYKVARFR